MKTTPKPETRIGGVAVVHHTDPVATTKSQSEIDEARILAIDTIADDIRKKCNPEWLAVLRNKYETASAIAIETECEYDEIAKHFNSTAAATEPEYVSIFGKETDEDEDEPAAATEPEPESEDDGSDIDHRITEDEYRAAFEKAKAAKEIAADAADKYFGAVDEFTAVNEQIFRIRYGRDLFVICRMKTEADGDAARAAEKVADLQLAQANNVEEKTRRIDTLAAAETRLKNIICFGKIHDPDKLPPAARAEYDAIVRGVASQLAADPDLQNEYDKPLDDAAAAHCRARDMRDECNESRILISRYLAAAEAELCDEGRRTNLDRIYRPYFRAKKAFDPAALAKAKRTERETKRIVKKIARKHTRRAAAIAEIVNERLAAAAEYAAEEIFPKALAAAENEVNEARVANESFAVLDYSEAIETAKRDERAARKIAADAADEAETFVFTFGAKVNLSRPSFAISLAHKIADEALKNLFDNPDDVIAEKRCVYNPAAAFTDVVYDSVLPPILVKANPDIALAAPRAVAKKTAANAVKRQGSPNQYAIYFAARAGRFEQPDLADMTSAAAEAISVFGLPPARIKIEHDAAKALAIAADKLASLSEYDTIAREAVLNDAEIQIAAADPRKRKLVENALDLRKALETASAAADKARNQYNRARDSVIAAARAAEAAKEENNPEAMAKAKDRMNEEFAKIPALAKAMNDTAKAECIAARRLEIARKRIYDARVYNDVGKMRTRANAMLVMTTEIIHGSPDYEIAEATTQAMYRMTNSYLGDIRAIRDDAKMPDLNIDELDEAVPDPRNVYGNDTKAEFDVRRRKIIRAALAEAEPSLTAIQKRTLAALYKTNGDIRAAARKLGRNEKTVRQALAEISKVFAAAIAKVAPNTIEQSVANVAEIVNTLGAGRAEAVAAIEKKSKAKRATKAVVAAIEFNEAVAAAITEAINGLPTKMHDATMLVAKGKSRREAATILGRNEKTVREAINTACRKISEAIAAADPTLAEQANVIAATNDIAALVKLGAKK